MGHRVGQEPPGWDRRNQEGTWGTSTRGTGMGQEEVQEEPGSDTKWDMGHWDGTGYEELDMRTWDRDKSHWEGTREGTGATESSPSPLYLLFPPGKLSPSHPCGDTPRHVL